MTRTRSIRHTLIAKIIAVTTALCQGLPAATQNPVDTTPIELSCRVVCHQFLYDTASFPSCHAATIEALPNGDLVAAFFGGSWEGCHDVGIWLCRKGRGDTAWSAPKLVAHGDVGDSVQHPCWNPVLYQVPTHKGELLLFYKTGIYIKDWVGHLLRSQDGGMTWSAPEHLGRWQHGNTEYPYL